MCCSTLSALGPLVCFCLWMKPYNENACLRNWKNRRQSSFCPASNVTRQRLIHREGSRRSANLGSISFSFLLKMLAPCQSDGNASINTFSSPASKSPSKQETRLIRIEVENGETYWSYWSFLAKTNFKLVRVVQQLKKWKHIKNLLLSFYAINSRTSF